MRTDGTLLEHWAHRELLSSVVCSFRVRMIHKRIHFLGEGQMGVCDRLADDKSESLFADCVSNFAMLHCVSTQPDTK